MKLIRGMMGAPGRGAGGTSPGGAAGDRGLVQAHRAGDPTAFARLLRRHDRYLRWVILQHHVSVNDVDDVMQEATLKALRHIDGYREDATVATWLHRIVVNTSMDFCRRRRVTAETPVADADLERSEFIDRAVLNAQHSAPNEDLQVLRLSLRAALDQLPRDQRAALHAIDVLGLSIEEAATALGVAPGTVKSRRARGRQRLRTALAEIRPEQQP